MKTTNRSTKKAREERNARISAAIAADIAALNAAIEAGTTVLLPEVSGYREGKSRVVGHVTADMRAFCPRDNGGFGFHYHLCNDGQWDSLLAQAGLKNSTLGI